MLVGKSNSPELEYFEVECLRYIFKKLVNEHSWYCVEYKSNASLYKCSGTLLDFYVMSHDHFVVFIKHIKY